MLKRYTILLRLARSLAECPRGATAIEYGLIIALIVIGIIASVSALGGRTGAMWSNMATKVNAATPSA